MLVILGVRNLQADLVQLCCPPEDIPVAAIELPGLLDLFEEREHSSSDLVRLFRVDTPAPGSRRNRGVPDIDVTHTTDKIV